MASVGTMSRGGRADLQGKVEMGVKNADLVFEKQKFYTDDSRSWLSRRFGFSSNRKWLSLPPIWMFKQSQPGLCGTPLSTNKDY